MLPHSELLKLARWNTPTMCNGWEQITKHSRLTNYNLEEVTDFMPQMGPMIGYAVTVQFEPSNVKHTDYKDAWAEYRKYVASVPGPKIVVLQDLDKPATYGSFWGEVNANVHMALGCVGTITDGSIRDVDEMTNAGFKAIARRLSPSHAYSWPVKWGIEVEAFGCKVQPGQLIHADKHGFLAIPPEDAEKLLEAAIFTDQNELETFIPAARGAKGLSIEETLKRLNEGSAAFSQNAVDKYGINKGEW